jgi:hypothetical protein
MIEAGLSTQSMPGRQLRRPQVPLAMDRWRPKICRTGFGREPIHGENTTVQYCSPQNRSDELAFGESILHGPDQSLQTVCGFELGCAN